MTTILDTLDKKAQNLEVAAMLQVLAKEIASAAAEHLKQVNSQLPEFDIHDASHSEKVIQNMEGLMKQEVIERLSSYELFLLYLAGYLHDCAMALPAWELHLLKMTEGMEGFTSNQLDKSFVHDGQTPYKLSKAIETVKENAEKLYGNYDTAKKYIFAFSTETEMQRDMAERLCDYQKFRNGYTIELKAKAKEGLINEYLNFSDLIRYEYVRTTHAQRIEQYIKNLAPLFTERLGGAWGGALAKDLSKICRSHGESMEYVKGLGEQASYFGEESANLQFVATMLRLADVLHFSHDRAPRSLFAEKMVRSKESLLHWTVKFQGINYTLEEIDANGRVKIKYMAYCDEPGLYYFIHQYLDWVDNEIENYFRFIQAMRYSIQTTHLTSNYELKIAESVDRTQIKYNEEKFKPVQNMKFTLNQNKILELLMGTGLYKNKYLCLRELYQNSLDACRCMISMKNVRGKIEFGLGHCTENNQTRTYLYCLDNGIGMTKDTIVNYFLKIGNSFYNSREFQRRNAVWDSSFKPTSQFGIGILSCFMIGDKIEITTKALAEDGGINEEIRFSIDGPHENFYYMQPDELDIEKIGQHGTLIKVFLKDEIILLDDQIPSLPLIIHGSSKQPYKDMNVELFEKWDKHIYKILSNSIAIPNESIDVKIRMEQNRIEELLPWDLPFNLMDYSLDDVKLMYSEFRYFSDGYNPIEDYIKIKPFVESKLLKLIHDDIEYRFLLNLPLPGMPDIDFRALAFNQVLYNESAVLVDGIAVGQNNMGFEFNKKRDLIRNGIINFIGSERPKLSVDRNSITDVPEELNKQLDGLPEIVSKAIIEEVKKHIKHYGFSLDSIEVTLLWNYIFNTFNSLTEELINYIVFSEEADMILVDLSKFMDLPISVQGFIQSTEVEMKDIDFRTLGPTEEIVLIGKLLEAKNICVNNDSLGINSNSFSSIAIYENTIDDGEILPIVIMADTWEGKFQQYDLVSHLWPIVSKDLFLKWVPGYDVTTLSQRAKKVAEYGNSIAGIASLDPVLIHPKMGAFAKRRRDALGREENWIGKFENPNNQFWLGELNDRGRLLNDHHTDYFLFAFISPRVLTQEEKVSLEDYREEEPEYYAGVKNGWSILFLGKTTQWVVSPGLVDRHEMVKKIKPSFWKHNESITYMFIDGTQVNSANKG